MIDRVARIGLAVVLIQALTGLFTWVLASSAEDVWVFFSDKPDGAGGRLEWLKEDNEWASVELDLPLDPHYIAQVKALGLSLRVCSRWFNAVTVHASPAQQKQLLELSFVRQVRPVQRFKRLPVSPGAEDAFAASKIFAQEEDPSFEQRAQIGVVHLHNLGYTGRGVRIALLDDGFHYVDHKTFAHLRDNSLIVAERDFINGDDVVSDQADQPLTGDERGGGQNTHGAQVLSLLAANHPGRLVGVAPEAEYILAKTEDLASEWPIEEDRWVAGLEWADSLGADIVNSSLGYATWDDGSGYTFADLDGATALTSVAAEMAVRKGIIVVEAVGNQANNPEWPYIIAPADAPGVIAVGAVDRRREIASFSSRGPTSDGRIKPDLVAPGVHVVVADIRGGDYMRSSGTSFAAPLVSGVCALLLQINPNWGPEEMLESLKSSARDLGVAGADTVYGWGLVQALDASQLEVFALGNNYPNPFNPATTIKYQLPQATDVRLEIFNVVGQVVRTLVADPQDAGRYTVQWDATNDGGQPLSSGIYFYRLLAGDFQEVNKMLLLK